LVRQNKSGSQTPLSPLAARPIPIHETFEKNSRSLGGVYLILTAAATFLFMHQKTFGKNPSGARLNSIRQSPHYRNGAFQNLHPTEVTLKNASFFKMMKDFLNKSANTVPPKPLPSIKTDLRALSADKPVIVWFGHSSCLIRFSAAVPRRFRFSASRFPDRMHTKSPTCRPLTCLSSHTTITATLITGQLCSSNPR